MRQSFGSLVARFLTGSWRHSPPPFQCSIEELNRIAPMLIRSGEGALAWRKIRDTELSTTPIARELEQVYRLSTLSAGVDEHLISEVVKLLQSVGVDPLLVKGWASARYYPDPGLRPYGDLDLCILPEHHSAARKVLDSSEAPSCQVDLHTAGFPNPGGLPNPNQENLIELLVRSQSVKLEGIEVKLASQEDHLRILCIHLLKHNARPPLWLCDIAAAVESRDADFDWGICLGTDPIQADWIACAISLSHQLLGADIDDTPIAKRARNLPKWLPRSVMRKWWMLRGPSWLFDADGKRFVPITAALRFGTHFDRTARIRLESLFYQGVLFLFALSPRTGGFLKATAARLTGRRH